MEINERLKYFREFVKKETTVGFSLAMGIAQTNYYAYENGSRGIPDDVYVKLHQIGCNINWLLTGEGLPTTDGDNNSQNQTINQNYNLGNPKIFNGAPNCENCPFPRTVEKLTEQIEKLSQKLIEKS